jgi:SAM-dependent methyltransferase
MPDHHRTHARAWATRPFDLHAAQATPVFERAATGMIAAVYNQAGDDYAAYADGDPAQLFAFDGLHAHADRQVWTLLETKLADLRASGASSLSLLDAGCGPGTWLRRLVTRAHTLGFTTITARGFDIAQAQISRAREQAQTLAGLPGVTLTFDIADFGSPLPEADASVDIALCLYSVLSHLPVAGLNTIADEIARVTSGYFVTTVRSIGSPPTAFVEPVEKVRRLQRNYASDRCDIELCDGRRMSLDFHLFAAHELASYFTPSFEIQDLRGLDLFHSRFAPDPRWNPQGLQPASQLSDELARLEEAYATDPAFIDRATHLLLVARRRCADVPAASVIDWLANR